MEKIKVIIADDSDFVRDGMKIILDVDDDFEVLGAASNGREAIELAMKEAPDVFLMDNALAAGAKGYLVKNHTPEHLKQMIKTVYNGTGVMEENILESLTKSNDAGSGAAASGFDGSVFSDRELDIIKAVADGLSNKEIADKLFISEGTVKNYITTILSKEGLSHRTALAVYYLTGRK